MYTLPSHCQNLMLLKSVKLRWCMGMLWWSVRIGRSEKNSFHGYPSFANPKYQKYSKVGNTMPRHDMVNIPPIYIYVWWFGGWNIIDINHKCDYQPFMGLLIMDYYWWMVIWYIIWLVVGQTPLKNMSSSIGMIILNIWENRSHVPVTTNQL